MSIPEPKVTSNFRVHPRFVGRAAEVRWLEQRLQEAIAGRPQVVVLIGESGLGKTRLQTELCDRARRAHIQVALGRPDEDLPIPYGLIADALEPCLESIASDAPEAVEQVRRLFSPRGVKSEPRADDEGAEHAALIRALRALESVIFSLLSQGPMLLCLDDLHWSDRPSLDLILRLVHGVTARALSTPVPLMLLCATRPVDANHGLASPLSRLQVESICSMIELGGIGENEVSELLQVLTGVRPKPRLVEAVHRLTLGNPLYVKEICHHLEAHGEAFSGRDTAARSWRLDELDLPPTLLTALVARMRTVEPQTRDLLTLAACVGEHFSAHDLSTAGPLEERTVLKRIEEAVRKGLLVDEGGGWAFPHPMLRHAFYHAPGDIERRRLHLQIARALAIAEEQNGTTSAIEIASHLIRAGPLADRTEVARRALCAGHQAFASHASSDAARFYAAALDAAGETMPEGERGELHVLSGVAHYRAGDGLKAIIHFEDAARCFARAGDAVGVARANLERTRVQITLEPVAYGRLLDVESLQKALSSLGAKEEHLRGRILSLLSGVYWNARNPVRALECSREAQVIAVRIGDPRLRSEASAALSVAHSQSGELRAALDANEQAVRAARKAGDAWLESTAFSRAPLLHLWSGEIEAADSAASSCDELSTRVHDWTGRSLALAARVAVAVARGRFMEAEQLAAETARMAERSGYPWGAFNAFPALACGRMLRGDTVGASQAIAHLSKSGQVFADPGPAVQLLTWVYRTLIDVHAGAGREQSASLLKALAALRAEEEPEIGAVGGFCAAVEIAHALNEPSAVAVPRSVLTRVYASGVRVSSGWVFLVPRVLGMAAALERDWDAAERYFCEATKLATHAGAPAELARTLFEEARMRQLRGATEDLEEIQRLASRARSLARTLGMHPLARAAGELSGTKEPWKPLFSGPEQENVAAIVRGTLPATARWPGDLFIAEAVGEPEPTSLSGVRATAALRALPPEIVIMMTDMVGSTQRIERLGEAGALQIMKRHNSILRRCLSEHHGTEIQHTGDGVFAFFLSPSCALQCAAAIQRALARVNEHAVDEVIEVRIGLAIGHVLFEEGRLFGAPVNAAARLCAAAQRGQILVPDEVRRLADGTGFSFRDLGSARLAGFEKPFRIHEIVW